MLIAVIVAVATLYFAQRVFIPFALAVLFAFLLTPVVRLLDRMHVPRAASSLIVVLVSVIGVGVLSWMVMGQLIDVANQLPAYRAQIRRKVELIRRSSNQGINRAAGSVSEIGKELVSPGSSPATSGQGRSGAPTDKEGPPKPTPVEIVPRPGNPLDPLNGFVDPVSTFAIVVVFTIFMLMRREDLRNRFIRLVGHRHLSVLTQALDDAGSGVSRYLLLQLGVNAGYGTIVGFGLYLIGIPHVLLWAVVSMLMRFLPYVGALLSGVVPLLLAVAMFDGWKHALLTLALYAIVEAIVSNAIEPLLFGSHLGLSSLAIMVAAIFWTVLWGPVGLILSTPLTVCLIVIGRYVPNLGFLHILLGDEPALSPESHFYQRLLASDQQEAKLVLENFLKENTLGRLYDSVLVPALILAEQDRHSGDLDDATQRFITLSTRDMIEEILGEYDFEGSPAGEPAAGEIGVRNSARSDALRTSRTIVCVPARDDADETVAIMLAQLLEQSGHTVHSISLGTVEAMIGVIEETEPDVVCISALPPFAVAHARHLYLRLRARLPKLKIFMGLWGFSGDMAQLAVRLRLRESDQVSVGLDQMRREINGETPPDTVPEKLRSSSRDHAA